MNLARFQEFVDAHRQKFEGVHPLSAADIARFEKALGYSLPATMTWLLTTRGYSECCGVDNLEEGVEKTLVCRKSISMPPCWLLLNDWNDAGIVLLDLPTGRICWCGAHNAASLARGEIDSDADWFDGYPEWTASRVGDSE